MTAKNTYARKNMQIPSILTYDLCDELHLNEQIIDTLLSIYIKHHTQWSQIVINKSNNGPFRVVDHRDAYFIIREESHNMAN